MAATPGTRPPLARRKSQVYVDIPASILHTPNAVSRRSSLNHGANNGQTVLPIAQDDDEEADLYPFGWFYCHQCEKKRGNEIRLQCTLRDPKQQNQRCKLKYCKPCLRNRYEQDFDELRANTGDDMSKAEKAKHVNKESYYFECFRCRDLCNCKKCRKRHGLRPTGRLEVPKKRPASTEDSELEPKPKKAKKSKPLVLIESLPPVLPPAPSKPQPKAKRPRAKPAPKPKPIPKPTWTKLHVPLSLSDFESRVLIREFIHRFHAVLQVSLSNVEELEELVGDTLASADEWEGGENGAELVSWVGEACLRSIIAGLLDVLAGRATASNLGELGREIKEAIKAIRASGANLNRIWSSTASLRSSKSANSTQWLAFPDPLPPPSTSATTYRSTRSGANNLATQSGVNVTCTAQLVPIVAFLVEQAIHSPAVREAIENGTAEAKDIWQAARGAISKENARYKEEMKGDGQGQKENKNKDEDKGGMKLAKQSHQRTLADLEMAQKMATAWYAPRFSTLGRDADGRVYYVLTPSASECEAAQKLVLGSGGDGAGENGKVKLKGKRGGFGEEERREMNRWSWFVCVHGERPADGLKAKDAGDGESSNREGDEDEKWWGFWNPSEVKKLAGWLTMKHDLDAEEGKEKKRTNEVAKPTASKSTSKLIPAPVAALASTSKSKLTSTSNSKSTTSKPNSIPKPRPLSNSRRQFQVSVVITQPVPKPGSFTSIGGLNGNGSRGRPSAVNSRQGSTKGKSRDISPLSDLSSSSDSSDERDELDVKSSSSSELSSLGGDSDSDLDEEEEKAKEDKRKGKRKVTTTVGKEDSDVEMEDARDRLSRPTPDKSEVRALVKGLLDYAEMLEWRIGRVSPEDNNANASGSGAGSSTLSTQKEKKEKEKVKEVPAARFYG